MCHVCVSDLIHCTNEMNVNVPQLADTLFERTANNSWVVVFKALITTHHLMMYGNEVSIHTPALVNFFSVFILNTALGYLHTSFSFVFNVSTKQ